MDRCADAAAIGVKKPDESLPAPASHSGSAETVSGSGWRCWQEADIVRWGRSLDPSDDSPGAPFVDRSPDAPSPLFVKSRIDRVWDDAVGPEELVFNWRKASSYGPHARRGLRRTLSSVLCGRLLDRAQDHVAPVDGQAVDDLVAQFAPAIGRDPHADEGSSRPAGVGIAWRRGSQPARESSADAPAARTSARARTRRAAIHLRAKTGRRRPWVAEARRPRASSREGSPGRRGPNRRPA